MGKRSKKMDEFIDKIDTLCYEYGYEIHPTKEGWPGTTNKDGTRKSFAIVGENEFCELLYIDGDGTDYETKTDKTNPPKAKK